MLYGFRLISKATLRVEKKKIQPNIRIATDLVYFLRLLKKKLFYERPGTMILFLTPNRSGCAPVVESNPK